MRGKLGSLRLVAEYAQAAWATVAVRYRNRSSARRYSTWLVGAALVVAAPVGLAVGWSNDDGAPGSDTALGDSNSVGSSTPDHPGSSTTGSGSGDADGTDPADAATLGDELAESAGDGADGGVTDGVSGVLSPTSTGSVPGVRATPGTTETPDTTTSSSTTTVPGTTPPTTEPDPGVIGGVLDLLAEVL